jgi:lipid-A-disaccharide synthase-like uncharacterized protein
MNHIFFYVFGLAITGWKIFGYLGVSVFVSRWAVQLYASRKAGRPVMTRWFWLLSLVGSISLLVYFSIGTKDSVGVMCNFFPAFIALYNLFLDIRYQKNLKNKANLKIMKVGHSSVSGG